MNWKKPLVYIVMPCYNSEKYLLEQLMSIYYQNYTNWYLIFVNDWSTDSSEEIIRNWISNYDLYDKVKVIIKENGGVNSAIQRWLEEVKNICDIYSGDSLVSYCDSDDIWTREKLDVQVKYMVDHLDCSISYHNHCRINEQWELIEASAINYFYHNEKFEYISTIWNNYISSSLMFRANEIDEIIPLPYGKWMAQDYWTIVLLSFLWKNPHFFDCKLTYHRISNLWLQRTLENKTLEEKANIRIKYFSFLKDRFPDKDLSYIYNYNEDRFLKWELKWYWRFLVYFLTFIKYPRIFFMWLCYLFCNFLKIKINIS